MASDFDFEDKDDDDDEDEDDDDDDDDDAFDDNGRDASSTDEMST